MLIRISLIIAILAGLGAGIVNFTMVKTRITTLTSQRDDWHSQYSETFNQLNTTKRELAATNAVLVDTQSQLADAQTARDKAVATADAQQKRADDLSDQLTKVTGERDDAQAQLASYKATGQTPQQVEQLVSDIKNDQDEIDAINAEKGILTRTVARLNNEILSLTGGPDFVVKLPANLEGRVLVVDPKWEFVVLDIGDEQGVLPQGEMLVSRDGKLVAKVVVRSVEKDRCIANIIPGWKLGDVYEGDLVTPAHPAT